MSQTIQVSVVAGSLIAGVIAGTALRVLEYQATTWLSPRPQSPVAFVSPGSAHQDWELAQGGHSGPAASQA